MLKMANHAKVNQNEFQKSSTSNSPRNQENKMDIMQG